jgi:phosphatidylinositol-bisphosphatase
MNPAITLQVELLASVINVSTDCVMRGAGGKVGNKGAVLIRMMVAGIKLEFCCCHLAAGQTKLLDRNVDFKSIAQCSLFRTQLGFYIRGCC